MNTFSTLPFRSRKATSMGKRMKNVCTEEQGTMRMDRGAGDDEEAFSLGEVSVVQESHQPGPESASLPEALCQHCCLADVDRLHRHGCHVQL
jgi:hypothetical protein